MKKTILLALILAMMAGNGINKGDNCSKINAKEKEQNYFVQASSKRELENALRMYDENESVTEVARNELVENNIAIVSLTENEVKELKESENIVSIEKDKKVKAARVTDVKKINCKNIDIEWNKKLIKYKKSKEDNAKKKVKIAVIDSGVDWGNDIDLEETVTLISGEEEINPLFMDGTGHGNSVAGLIAAKDNNEGITGINPNAIIYSVRVLDDNNEAPLSRVIDGIYYAISKKVDIINMSFGLDSYSETLKKAIDAAENAGILVVAAAGNTSDNVQYPAAYDSVLAVGSVDSNAFLADSSARGEKIDVVAPGELVCSTGQFGDMIIESGTSLAAPQVAAVASKIMEENPNATNAAVRNAIIYGANYSIEGRYGLLDEKYVLENYDELSKHDNNDKIIEINDTEINDLGDTGCVKGSWRQDIHEAFIGSDHSNVKKGARFPDSKQRFKTITDNPWWHGSYHVNYIAAYIYASRMAEKLGNTKNPSDASKPSALSNDEASNMLGDVNSIDWNSVGMTTKGQKRAFAWGLAMHTAADIFAHSVFVYSGGKWNHLAHGGEHNGKKVNDYADNTDKFDGRFFSAENVVKTILRKYDADSGAGSYKDFCNMDASKKDYRLRDLTKNIKEVTSDNIGKPYSDFNLSITDANKGIIEYFWEG